MTALKVVSAIDIRNKKEYILKKNKFCAALCTVIAAVLLCSCSQIIKMSYNEDGLLCGGGAKYRFAPPGYEPTYQGEEYALIDNAMQETLYTIGTCDPEKWLTTEFSGAATLVYYAEDITLPTLEEMEPEVMYFCDQGETVSALYTLKSDENSIVKDIIALLGDESLDDEIWPRSDISETYQLKFYSPKWEAIYYNVVYAVGQNGGYLYDRVNDRCIFVGELLSEYNG